MKQLKVISLALSFESFLVALFSFAKHDDFALIQNYECSLQILIATNFLEDSFSKLFDVEECLPGESPLIVSCWLSKFTVKS